jgi:adenosylcobinamide-phosphate synthase
MLINLAAAFALDLLVGDPVFQWHPVRLIGKMLARFEKAFYGIRRKVLGGGLLVASAFLVVFLVTMGVSIPGRYLDIPLGFASVGQSRALPLALNPLVVILVFCLFCNRDMLKEAGSVYEKLAAGDMPGARIRLARIVGRDTSRLDRRAIIRATVETVAENLVDGFTSPLFYLLAGGVPLAYLFKTASTIDSMFGYRNERYEKFGKIGARCDDALNFVPARLNVLFMFAASGFSARLWRSVIRFGRAHPSPNSAIAEAAFAGWLGLALGGPCVYGGVEKVKPWIGLNRLSPRELEDPAVILRANRLYLRTALLIFFCGCAALAFLPPWSCFFLC